MQEVTPRPLTAISAFEESEPGMAAFDAMDRRLDRIEESLRASEQRARRDCADVRNRALRAIGTELVGADMSLRPKVWARDPRLDGQRTAVTPTDVFESVLLAGSVTIPEAAKAEVVQQHAIGYADALLPSRIIRAAVPQPGKAIISGPEQGERWYNRLRTRVAIAAGAAALLLGAASGEGHSTEQPTRAETTVSIQTNTQ